jgi:cyanophycin synthetase
VADAVHPEKSRIILNADDPRVLAMKEDARAPVVLFSLHPDSEAVRGHLSEGGTVFTIEGTSLVLRDGVAPSAPIVKVFEVPITLGGKALYNVSNALAAAAAAHALLGLGIEDLRTGLSTFNPSIGQSPGRLNLFEVDGVDYLIDYAHNVPAFLALNQVVASLSEKRPHGHRRIGVVSGTGNRLDVDITRLGETAAHIYTDLIIKDSDPRHRMIGETAEIMRVAALGAGLPEEKLRIILSEQEAIEAAFSLATPGDLVVIQPDDIQGTIRMLLEHKEERENIDLFLPPMNLRSTD